MLFVKIHTFANRLPHIRIPTKMNSKHFCTEKPLWASIIRSRARNADLTARMRVYAYPVVASGWTPPLAPARGRPSHCHPAISARPDDSGSAGCTRSK